MSDTIRANESHDGAYRRAGSSFAAQLLSFCATVLNRVVLLAVLLRLWGPDQLSEWIVAGSVAVFIGLPDAWLQIQFGNLYHSGYAAGQHERIKRWVGIAIVCYATAYGALIAVAIPLLVWTDIAALIASPGRDVQHLSCLLALLIADRAIVSLRGATVHLYRATGDVSRLINSSTLLSVTSTTGVIAAVLLGASSIAAAWILIVIDLLLGLIVLVIDLSRRMHWLVFRPVVPTSGELRQLARNTIWYATDHGGLIVVNDLPVILLAAMNASPAFIVAFTMARTIANFVRQLQMAAANSIALELVDRALRTRATIPADVLAHCAGTLSLVSAILAAAVAAQSGAILLLWTGKAPQIESLNFLPLYIAVVSGAPLAISSLILSYTNEPRANAIARLVQMAIIVCVSLGLPAVPPVIAVVLGVGLAEVVAQGVVLPLLMRGHQAALDLRNLLEIAGRLSLAFLLMYGLGHLIGGLVHPEGWTGAVFGGAITAFTACVASFVVVAPQDRHRIRLLLSDGARRLLLRRTRM